MKEREFQEKAMEMVGITGVDLIVTETTPAMTYDGLIYFKNVLAFDMVHDGTVLLSINLNSNGEFKSVSWNNMSDRAYAMAQVDVLNRLFKGTKNFYIRGDRK